MKKIMAITLVCCIASLIPVCVAAGGVRELYMEDFKSYAAGELPVFPSFISFNPHGTALVNEVQTEGSGKKYFRMSSPAITATGQSGMSSTLTLNPPAEFRQSDIFLEFSARKSASSFLTTIGGFSGVPLISWTNSGTMSTRGYELYPANDWGNAFGDHNANTFYKFRIIYARNVSGYYNAYVYMDSGSGYAPVRAVANMAAEHGVLINSLDAIDLATISNNSWRDPFSGTLDFEYFRIYAVNRPNIVSSSIDDAINNVYPDTREMTVTFEDEVKPETVETITIRDTSTTARAIVQSVVSGYNTSTRTATIKLEETLVAGRQYALDITGVENVHGLPGIQDYAFKTSTAPLSRGSLAFWTKSELLSNLTGNTPIYANVRIANNTAEAQDVLVVVAVYNEKNILQKITAEKRTVPGNNPNLQINNIGLDGVITQSGWYAKAFVLGESPPNAVPIGDYLIISH